MPYPDWVMKYKKKGTLLQKKGEIYYMYRVHSKWNPEKGRAQLITDEYLGRITPEGLIEPKYKRIMKRYDQVSVKEYGATSLLLEISGDIQAALKDNFPEWREIFVFACMRLIHNTPIKNLEFHYSESFLSEEMKDVTTYPKHTGEMLRSIGMDRSSMKKFMEVFLQKGRHLAVDLTHVFSFSDDVISATLGHDPQERHLPVVQILFLFNLEEHEPSYFRMLAGSITSVMSIVSTMDESGISNVVLVADTGFYSAVNLKKLESRQVHYIMPLKRNSSLIPYDAEMIRYFIFEKRPVWYTHDSKRGVYLFRDPGLRAEEEKDFLRRSEGRRGAVSRFRAAEKRMGTIAVITDLRVSGEIVYDMLKSRSEIEQAYDTFKNTLDADRTYMRTDEGMQGWMFVNFIALMLLYRIYNILRKKDLLSRYSPRDVIEHLGRVHKLKAADEWKMSEIPKKSRKIIEDLELHIM